MADVKTETPETMRECVARVSLMANDADGWTYDLSENDRHALTVVLRARADLLAALKEIASISYDRFDCQEGDVSEHVEIAEAAIAKAAGR